MAYQNMAFPAWFDYVRDFTILQVLQEITALRQDLVHHGVIGANVGGMALGGPGRVIGMAGEMDMHGALGHLGGLGGVIDHDLLADRIRRHNILVTILNSRVSNQTPYAEVHPKFNAYGEMPREFQRPRQLNEFFDMDATTLDLILQSYDLPNNYYANGLLGGGGYPRGLNYHGSRMFDRHRCVNKDQLAIFFEFLGVDYAVDHRFTGGGGCATLLDGWGDRLPRWYGFGGGGGPLGRLAHEAYGFGGGRRAGGFGGGFRRGLGGSLLGGRGIGTF